MTDSARGDKTLMAWFLALTVCIALAACTKKEAAAGGNEEKVQPVVGAKTAVAEARPFSETVGAIGSVVARAGHVASLSAPAQTRVAEVLVSAGDRVSRGQTLVRLEQGIFQAAAQGAEAKLTAAQLAFERAERLANEGIAPRKDVEQARAEVAAARAEATGARRTSELSVLRAPIAGVITRLTATLGASVDANQPLVEIADPTTVDLLFSLTPTEAARVHAGMPVSVGSGQSSGGERLGSGKVVDVAGTVDSATRSVSVRARASSWRRPLRIGETVFGQIAIATRAGAIVVPTEALVPDGEGFKVFVVDEKGLAHVRPVSVGARADAFTEVTKGLAAGERVVTYGAYGVEDGAKVVSVDASPGAKSDDEKDEKKDAKDAKDAKDEKDDKKDDAKQADAKKGGA